MTSVFIVHHNPDRGKYSYGADATDAVRSARSFLRPSEGRWVAGNCRRKIRVGDLLLFKFGGRLLQQEPGIYAAARVTASPVREPGGDWTLRYRTDAVLTKRLVRAPILEKQLSQWVPRSFGASIQHVSPSKVSRILKQLGPNVLGLRKEEPEPIRHGLVIHKEPLDKILSGRKTWEVRGSSTVRRGPIALIEGGSGTVVGTCRLIDVRGPLKLSEMRRNARRTGFLPTRLYYPKTYAWVLCEARRLQHPVSYRHPQGAIIWVKLSSQVTKRLREPGT